MGKFSSKMPIAVYGATGYTGQLVARELERRGHPLVLVARDEDKLNRVALLTGHQRVTAAVEDGSLLREAFSKAGIVVNCAGPFAATGGHVLSAALDAGCHYLDTAAEQIWLFSAFEKFGARATEVGRAAVPQAGFFFLIGDLLADLLTDSTSNADLVKVGYSIHGWRLTPGSEVTVPLVLGPRVSYRAGEWRHETPSFSPAEFDFPAPLGRTPVVTYPAGEVVSIPRHVGTDEVEAYMSFGEAPRRNRRTPRTGPTIHLRSRWR